MSTPSAVQPVINRPDVTTVLVAEVITRGPERQRALAEAIVAHWQAIQWPSRLISLNCFVSTDGESVLTYAQWSSDEALSASLRDEGSVSRPPTPGWGIPGVQSPEPQRYRLYRVVRGGAITGPAPVARCFPAAIFKMENHEAARGWVDGLLASEEATEGEERDYPGAIAANFHISVDGTSVFLLSEWASEEEAVSHIAEVIEPILEQVGSGDTGAGARYQHHTSLVGPLASS
ncbi:hypothetical protein ACQEVC_35185 [Plantactinospora sp. CA-294935]|uniref:hypothetical protein n=1 Tax=Plantactinospora sp. CA-294935 TaxID=3240012 RepID=UPI003D9224CD